MEVPDTGKKEHRKEEDQAAQPFQPHPPHTPGRSTSAGGRLTWWSTSTASAPCPLQGPFSYALEKKYLALTGRKYDKVEGLIAPEQIAKVRKQEEEDGGEKNKGVIYELIRHTLHLMALFGCY
ncbi:hypothetical protein PVAP13_7KG096009 [Panicum virgatum]|uniref:Uncharacterized protein n=1 Tax=Panicum virgatum TaxID=38727 RepID=A0A8T0QIW6_PANVG|nr:hypothetical protein PVAP13_7KG096009 [Panicum virgatum]